MKGLRKKLRDQHACHQDFLNDLLQEACVRGRTDAAKCLLNRGADPNSCLDGGGFPTAFLAAIARGTAKIVRLLVRHGARLQNDPPWISQLGEAACRGDVAIMRAVLTLGADPNGAVSSEKGAECDVTPIILAIASANTSCVELLLRSGADANFVCRHLGIFYPSDNADSSSPWEIGPCTPLKLAEATCNHAAARILRRFGASEYLPSRSEAPFHVPLSLRARALDPIPKAVRLIRGRARFEAIRSQLVRVRNLDESHGCLLVTACLSQRVDVVRHLLDLGAKPECMSALRSLSELDGGSIVIARLLLDHGYDATNHEVKVPVIEAIRCGHTRLVRLLLARGANPNLIPLRTDCRHHELTPLMAAISEGRLDYAALLFAKGADANVGCGGFPMPENCSFLLGKRSISFLDLPYDLNDPCDSTGGPLHIAVLTGNVGAVSLLLRHGASPTLAAGLDQYVAQVQPLNRRVRIEASLRKRGPHCTDELVFG